MPRIPMPPTDEKALAENTTENYAALGKFVEAFEAMVDDVREICIDCIYFNVRDGDDGTKPEDVEWGEWFERIKQKKILIEVAFHSPGMTAKSLFDIMKAIIVEVASIKDGPYYLDCDEYKDLLTHIEKEYSSLYWKRNDLLHGTWHIGYVAFDDPNAKQFDIRRYRITANGLERVSKLPKNAAELSELSERCSEARNWIGTIGFCLKDKIRIATFFKREIITTEEPKKKKKEESEWKLFLTENSAGTTLPKK